MVSDLGIEVRVDAFMLFIVIRLDHDISIFYLNFTLFILKI